ncbi:MAG: DUF4175 domain-containing protein [Terricaulis sp.]|nr:DUF4175 domain-containing protein [Terricaulis sp.]
MRRAARLLDTLTMAPHDGYFRDLAVFLGLRLARSQLDVAQGIDETREPAQTLWLTALRAEYGGAADARRALEEAQRQLAEALQRNAPPEEIRQRMEALRQATRAYMEALVQQAMRDGSPSKARKIRRSRQNSPNATSKTCCARWSAWPNKAATPKRSNCWISSPTSSPTWTCG